MRPFADGGGFSGFIVDDKFKITRFTWPFVWRFTVEDGEGFKVVIRPNSITFDGADYDAVSIPGVGVIPARQLYDLVLEAWDRAVEAYAKTADLETAFDHELWRQRATQYYLSKWGSTH